MVDDRPDGDVVAVDACSSSTGSSAAGPGCDMEELQVQFERLAFTEEDVLAHFFRRLARFRARSADVAVQPLARPGSSDDAGFVGAFGSKQSCLLDASAAGSGAGGWTTKGKGKDRDKGKKGKPQVEDGRPASSDALGLVGASVPKQSYLLVASGAHDAAFGRRATSSKDNDKDKGKKSQLHVKDCKGKEQNKVDELLGKGCLGGVGAGAGGGLQPGQAKRPKKLGRARRR